MFDLRNLKLNNRVWILLFLLAGTLLVRGLDIYQVYFRSSVSPLFGWSVRDGRMVVESITDKDQEGNVVPVDTAGLRVQDRILEIYNARGEGKVIRNSHDYYAVLRTISNDEPWTMICSREGKQIRLTVSASALPARAPLMILEPW